MHKGRKITTVLVFTNIIFLVAVALLAWKGGYLKSITSTLGIAPRYSYSDNVQYVERTSLFSIYEPALTEIVFVGDSITQRCDFNELFGITSSVNRGIGSDTTEGVLNRIADIIDLHPKKIFIMIGVNDLGLNVSQDIIKANYRSILSILNEKLQDTQIYVLSVLPVSNGKIASSRIVALNSIINDLAEEYENKYIDLYTIMSEKGELRAELTIDGVHLLGNGYLLARDALTKYVFKP